MSLRRALVHVWQPSTAFGWRPQLVQREVERIGRLWGERKEQTPPLVELDATVSRVRAAWSEGRALRDLERRDRSLLPYVLFHPAGNGREREWLGADAAFAHGFLTFLAGESRALSSTAFVLLRDYPRLLATFEQLRQGFCATLVRDEGLRTEIWRNRQRIYALFSPEGPAQLATILSDGAAHANTILEDAGLVDELAVGNFMREVHGRMLGVLGERLASGADAVWVRRPFEFLAGSGGRLRFDDESAAVANALFLPYARVGPQDSTRRAIQDFALEYLNDPRVSPKKWLGAPDARDVFLQWMVGATLEQFFRIISKSAKANHWRYRRKFWGAYLKRGLIQDAWVVLGDQAREHARAILEPHERRYGTLTGTTSDKSVLWLRVSGLTIAEWSHDSPCFVWPANAPRAPGRQKQYEKEQLRGTDTDVARGLCYSQWHRGSETYKWQGQLASHIERQVGVRVSQSEYTVRG